MATVSTEVGPITVSPMISGAVGVPVFILTTADPNPINSTGFIVFSNSSFTTTSEDVVALIMKFWIFCSESLLSVTDANTAAGPGVPVQSALVILKFNFEHAKAISLS